MGISLGKRNIARSYEPRAVSFEFLRSGGRKLRAMSHKRRKKASSHELRATRGVREKLRV
jgi:hypothetical protein